MVDTKTEDNPRAEKLRRLRVVRSTNQYYSAKYEGVKKFRRKNMSDKHKNHRFLKEKKKFLQEELECFWWFISK